MVTSATAPLTARDLLTRVVPFGLTVEGRELVLAGELPLDLESALRVLHAGVRAALTGRAWWGATTESKPRVVELRTDSPVPVGIGLLCVEGDRRCDRIAPDARLDCPQLFVPVSSGPSARSRK